MVLLLMSQIYDENINLFYTVNFILILRNLGTEISNCENEIMNFSLFKFRLPYVYKIETVSKKKKQY